MKLFWKILVSSNCSSILKTVRVAWLAWDVWNLEEDEIRMQALFLTVLFWELPLAFAGFRWQAGVGKDCPVICCIVLPFISLLWATRETTFIKTYGQNVLGAVREKYPHYLLAFPSLTPISSFGSSKDIFWIIVNKLKNLLPGNTGWENVLSILDQIKWLPVGSRRGWCFFWHSWNSDLR